MENNIPNAFDDNTFDEQEQPLQLMDYLRIMYRGRWIILFSFLIVFIATLIYTLKTPPTYEAKTTLLIESNNSMEQSLFNLTSFGTQANMLTNQMEILKSRNIAERVVRRLEQSDVKDSISFFHPLEDGTELTFNDRVGIVMNSMEVDPKRDTDILTLTYKAGSPFEAAYIANTIAQEFAQQNAETNRLEVTEMRKFIEDRLKIKAKELKNSEERLRDFQQNEKIVSLDAETTELVSRLSETESMLEEAKIELKTKEGLMKNIKQKLDERKQALATNLTETSTPFIQSLQEELAKAEAERTIYLSAIKASATNSQNAYFQDELRKYDEKIKALRAQLKNEAQKLVASNMVSDPLQISQELVTNMITLTGEINATKSKINALEGILAKYNNRLEQLPDKVLQLARLQRKQQVDEKTYIMLTQKLEEAKIQESAQARNVRIIDKAIKPIKPVKPNKRMNVMLGVLLGLGLGVGLTFMIEYLDRSVRKPEDIERMGLNVLATIPQIEVEKAEKAKKRLPENIKLEARLITHIDPKSPVSEAYRTLRTNLQFSKVEKSLRSILVTSAGPKEGKSTTAANLAITMAQVGNKVALIDADLRRPIIHSAFGMDRDEGLTNYLAGSLEYEQMLHDSFLDNLKVVTSGVLPPNPAELLATEKMENLLKKLQEDFDIVIIDSPPIIAVTDATILSTKVDGTLLIVYAGQTERDAIKRAITMLNSVSSRILGIVLNGFDVRGIYGSYYYYYYHHYYGETSKKRRNRIFG